MLDFLAHFTFERRVGSSGRISLGRTTYNLGKPVYHMLLKRFGEPLVWVQMEPQQREWTIYVKPFEQTPPNKLLARFPAKNLDVATLTGPPPNLPHVSHPIQLTLPCLVA
ncbi:MAG: hypothetical protein AB1894_13880 [Chloroflexota bacterium]